MLFITPPTTTQTTPEKTDSLKESKVKRSFDIDSEDYKTRKQSYFS